VSLTSLLIGTSGWSYDEWIGPFYDKKQGMFTNYAKVFRTTEINSTFYSYPTERLVEGWTRTAPPGFVFAAKLPQLITHDKWLKLSEGVEDDMWRFIQVMQPLAEKLGPILIQLRPMFTYKESVADLEKFLEILPKNHEWAIEFRHDSWLRKETFQILEKHNIAYTIVDEPLLPPETHITADFAYIRWHGHGKRIWYDYDYTKPQLEEWKPKVDEVKSRVKRTYGYFNNHFNASAVKNAVELLQSIGAVSPEQEAALAKIKEHRSGSFRPGNVQPLESYKEQEEGLSVADLLTHFTDTGRLARAEQMPEEVRLTLNTKELIKAKIKDYTIEIDLSGKVIRHDCDDWKKTTDRKRMCKHVDKFFLTLPQGQSRRILERIWEEKDDWTFE
jgi:uncharacterized protein YecE (DUF72 family)